MQDAQSRFVQMCREDPKLLDEIDFYLSQFPVFAKLDAGERQALLGIGRAVLFDKGELLFRCGDTGQTFHLVLSGKVLLMGRHDDGSAHVVAERILGEGFGEIGFLTESPRNLTAMVDRTEDSLQILFQRVDFEQLVQDAPRIGLVLYSNLVTSIHERLEPLPGYYRNLVMWGYRPHIKKVVDATGAEVEAVQIPRPVLFGLLGAGIGVLDFIVVRLVLQSVHPEILGLMGIRHQGLLLLLMLLASAIPPVLLGQHYDELERRLLYDQSNPRCCAQCKFVLYRENDGKHHCLFATHKDLRLTFKPGTRPDSYTDCPSFEQVEAQAVKAQQRDTMSRD